jgi:RNA polymerase sigma factor (sigma-70 family)
MDDASFEETYSVWRVVAAVRAARIVKRYALPSEDCRDLRQEALLGLWQARHRFKPDRADEKTYAETVVGNRLTSCIRHLCAKRCGRSRTQALCELTLMLVAPQINRDLDVDIERVLADVSAFDQAVARCLMDRSASETGRVLHVSRATVYRSIERLRAAFTVAGLGPTGGHSLPDRRPDRYVPTTGIECGVSV